MAAGFEGLSPEEICAYVKEQIPSISDEILERFKEHEIDGSVFLELNDEYLREIAPRLGESSPTFSIIGIMEGNATHKI